MIPRSSNRDDRVTTRFQGRPAATTAARHARAPHRIFLALALCVPAFAAMAAPATDDGAPFPTKTPAAQAIAVAQPSQPSLTDRALDFALDVNRLISPAAALTDAIDAVPAEDGKARSVLQKALTVLGTPYRWGGTDPDKGFDCSGLVGYVFRNALGVELPRVSRDMAKTGQLITERAKLVAGDLVFFGRKGRVDHVGIYVGDGQFVHAPSRGKDVTVSSLDKGYWSGRFMQARRVGTDGT
jgi:cell wall-associated NlpC family hydrolase